MKQIFKHLKSKKRMITMGVIVLCFASIFVGGL
jgi:hypothetical protein